MRVRIFRQNGFTLIEILLVLLITTILILGVNTAYRQAHLIWSNAENKRPIYANTRLLTETLREELFGLYMPQVSQEEQFIPFYLATWPDGKVQLSFCTLNPSWKSAVHSSKISKVTYTFNKSSDTTGNELKRTEQYCAGEKVIGTKNSDVIFKGLSNFRVLAYISDSASSSSSWQANFESKDAPPKAVKIIFKWFVEKEKKETTFEAEIPVPCQAKLGSE
jgi:prepilin-type N-terminal cleavage/methylation domain-containing protein